MKRVHDEGGDEVRVLVQGGVYQSASYVGERWAEPVFAYYRAFDDVFEAEDAMRDAYGHGIDRMLMLGGGGFAYPKFALMSHESLRMDVIEYDAEITRLARRWFYLDELERTVGDRLRVITAEARSYLGVTSVGHRRYDVVVSDCFGGAEPVRELATVEALRLVRGSLNPGGHLCCQYRECEQGERRDVPARLRCRGTRGIRPRLGGPMRRRGVRRRGKLPARRQ